ncbi:MAG: hypothetical protein Q7U51_02825 [Methanoregula sp.]|nr:hypothetical protein [Methanoregula sp.]
MKKVHDSLSETSIPPHENDTGRFPMKIKVRKGKGKEKKKGRSILETVKNVKIEVVEPLTISPVRPLSINVPGFLTEKTEIGVAEISGNKALYLRLSLRSDN